MFHGLLPLQGHQFHFSVAVVLTTTAFVKVVLKTSVKYFWHLHYTSWEQSAIGVNKTWSGCQSRQGLFCAGFVFIYCLWAIWPLLQKLVSFLPALPWSVSPVLLQLFPSVPLSPLGLGMAAPSPPTHLWAEVSMAWGLSRGKLRLELFLQWCCLCLCQSPACDSWAGLSLARAPFVYLYNMLSF